MSDPENLQDQIDEILQSLGNEVIKKINLAPWSEVSDLNMNVDLDITLYDLSRREFTIMSLECVNEYLSQKETDSIVIGNPLILVGTITGDVIVKSILENIELENGDKAYR